MISHVKINKYYNDEGYRSNILPFHIFFVNPESTNKQVYHKLCKYYAEMFKVVNYSL